jgi:hypothetical protein
VYIQLHFHGELFMISFTTLVFGNLQLRMGPASLYRCIVPKAFLYMYLRPKAKKPSKLGVVGGIILPCVVRVDLMC